MEHGSFVFRDNGDGCITAKYIHDGTKNKVYGPFSEACVLIDKTEDRPFTGTYHSVWLEHEGNDVKAILKIAMRHDNNAIFDLSWFTESETSPKFRGIAMLYDGLLIGTYWLI